MTPAVRLSGPHRHASPPMWPWWLTMVGWALILWWLR